MQSFNKWLNENELPMSQNLAQVNVIPSIIAEIQRLISEYEQETAENPKAKWKIDGITSGLGMALDVITNQVKVGYKQ